MSPSTYCHCYLVFNCDPAVAEAEGPNGEWTPLCDRCMQIAFDAGIRVRKLQAGQPDWDRCPECRRPIGHSRGCSHRNPSADL